ncbi:MAG: shikimate dehydrogenase family protein, partial [Micrococcales bacterium]
MATKHLGVVGSPIDHSKSPAIHTAAYRVLKLDWDYVANEVVGGNLDAWLAGLDENWIGVSVTAPLKEEAAAYAVRDMEKALGSANTLVRAGNSWKAYNTDVFGIQQALDSIDASSVRAVTVIGAGATAKSALAAVSR